MIAPLGIKELGAVGQAGILFSVIMVFCQGILYVFIPLFAKIDDENKSLFFSNALIFSIILSLFVILAMPLLVEIYKLTGQPQEVVVLADEYLRTIKWSSLFTLPLTICIYLINYNEDSKVIVFIVIIGNIINTILNFMFIYGFSILPEMSVTGVALATIFARLVTFLMAFIYVLKEYNIRVILNVKFSYITDFLRFGLFKGISYSNEWFSSFVLVLLVGTAGTLYVGANQIADILSSILYMFPQATVNVIMIYISKVINGKYNYLKIRKQLFRYSSLMYIIILLLGLILTPLSIKLFSVEETSFEYKIAFTFMLIHLAFFLIYCYQNYYLAYLDAILDVKVPAIFGVIVSYVFVIPIAFLITRLNLNVAWIWVVDGIGSFILLLIYYTRCNFMEIKNAYYDMVKR